MTTPTHKPTPSLSNDESSVAPSSDELVALTARLEDHAELNMQWERWELDRGPSPSKPLRCKDTADLLQAARAEIVGLFLAMETWKAELADAVKACNGLAAQLTAERQQREAAEGALARQIDDTMAATKRAEAAEAALELLANKRTEDSGKRCFTYCGPDRCTCGADPFRDWGRE